MTIYVITYEKKKDDFFSESDFFTTFKERHLMEDQAKHHLIDDTISNQKIYEVDLLRREITRIYMELYNGKIIFKEEK